MPFSHPDVHLVDDIRPFERRKLHLLNLAHTWLVARVLDLGLGEEVTLVRQAIDDPRLGEELEKMLRQEVVPVLDQELPGMGLEDYVDSILDRFRNPWLDHRLADIAQNHPQKLERRLAPVVQMAARQGREVPRLTSAFPSTASASTSSLSST